MMLTQATTAFLSGPEINAAVSAAYEAAVPDQELIGRARSGAGSCHLGRVNAGAG
jgi:hypothetical protein